jgi:small subunit ribosomal protein S17
LTAKQTGLRGKMREGTVVSDKMQKTIVVAIQSNFRHRLYKKTVRRIRRFMAHDERGDAKLGDRVRIVETSPVSRRKRWRLLDVLIKAELPEVAPESIDLELLGEVKPEEPEIDEAAALEERAAPKAEEAVPAEAVSSPEAEAVVPEEVDVAEEVPDIEAAVEEEQSPEVEAETEAEPEESVELEEDSAEAQAESEEAPAEEETSEEEKSS